MKQLKKKNLGGFYSFDDLLNTYRLEKTTNI